MTTIGPVISEFDPTNSSISYTDHSGVSVNIERARFSRPVTHDSMQHISPGARVRFRTNSKRIVVKMGFNGLATTDYGDLVTILSNGNPTDYSSSGNPSNFNKVLEFNKPDYRNIEVVFPFGGSIDFKGISIDPGSDFQSCLPRPNNKILFIGDSITQGALSTKTRVTYPYVIGQNNKSQIVNVGISGGRLIHFSSLDWISSINPNIVCILLGVNDFGDQLSEATFKSRYTKLLNDTISLTSASIKVVTPIWTNVSRSIPISTYRSWIVSIISNINNPRITAIDGLGLVTNSTSFIPDGIHPNDAGFAMLAENLNNYII